VQQRVVQNTWLDLLDDVLKKIPSKVFAKAERISERAIRAIRIGHAKPSAKTRSPLLKAENRFQR
jgi:hypothetical protein